jgi:hypothetical protein
MLKWLVKRLLEREKRWGEPVPEDWPPEGSVHFLPLRVPYPNAPAGFFQYEFAANVGEDDPMVVTLSREIILELCRGRQVLTVLRFTEDKNGKRPSFREIERLRATASVYREKARTALLTVGVPPDLFSAYGGDPGETERFFDFYLFSQPLSQAEEGLKLADAGRYQMWLCPSDAGEFWMHALWDPAWMDVSAVERVIGDVCRRHDVLFQNPRV